MQRTSRARCAICRKSDRRGMRRRQRVPSHESRHLAERPLARRRSRSVVLDHRHAAWPVAPNGWTGHVIFSEPFLRKRVRDHVQIPYRPVGIRALSGAVCLPDRVRAASTAVARHCVGRHGRAGIVAGRTDPRHRPGAPSCRAESLGHGAMHDQRHSQGVQLNTAGADRPCTFRVDECVSPCVGASLSRSRSSPVGTPTVSSHTREKNVARRVDFRRGRSS